MNYQKITRICLAVFACAILAAACVYPYDDDGDSRTRLITGSGAYGDEQPEYAGRLLGPRESDPAGALAGHDYRTFGDGQPNYAARLLGPRAGMPLAFGGGGSPLRPEV